MATLADIVDYGLASARPAAGVPGRLYFASDTGVLSRDNGATWDSLAPTSAPPSGTAGGALTGSYPNPTLADADLTAIAAATFADDDVVQRKSGSLTNRTMAQLKTDLALAKADVGLGNVDNTSNATERAAAATLTNKTLTTPTIADLTNATHSHTNAAGGGSLGAAAIGSGVLAIARLATGTPDGTKFIRDDGALAVPAGSGFANPMTTAADLIVGGTSGAPARLAKGSDGQVLTVDPTTHLLVWATPSGGGAALTVEEVDGSPTDSAVTKIVFPNGTLGIASHVATYTPSGGGGSSVGATLFLAANYI